VTNYTIFDKETIKGQFNKIKTELTDNLSQDILMKEFHKILVNRIMPSLVYNADQPNITLFRVTTEFENFDKNKIECFSFPPSSQAKRNRANIANFPVLYTASDISTAVLEMKDQLKNGDRFYVSKWQTNFSKNHIAHWLAINSITLKNENVVSEIAKSQVDYLSRFIKNVPNNYEEGFLFSIEEMGNLFTHKGVDLYHITSAYCHQLLYDSRELDPKIEIDFLVYPSVQNDHESLNIVFHPSMVETKEIILKEIFEFTLKENKLNFKEEENLELIFHGKAKVENNKINWLSFKSLIDKIHWKEMSLITFNNQQFKGDEIDKLRINNNKKYSVKKWLKQSLATDFVINEINKRQDLGTLTSLDDLSNHVTKQLMIFEFKHGNEVQTKNGMSCIFRLSVPVELKVHFSNIN
jgi:hypothetical protein